MFYAIDFDTRTVESKSEDGELLASYVADNDLTLAIALVSSEEDLSLEMSLGEINDVYMHLTNDKIAFKTEEQAAEKCWEALVEHGDYIPDFSVKLGKKLLKAANKSEPQADNNQTADEPKTIKAKPVKVNKGIRAKDLIGMTFNNTDKSPRAGSAMAVITDFIEENLGEATLDEVVQAFVDNYVPAKSTAVIDEKYALGYIRGAFNEGYIEEGL